jgi:3-isopropylmalate/(R)-2-methylmalate dehydratase small subunit
VISTSFADIFKGNCYKNGLLPVSVAPDVHARLRGLVEKDRKATVRVDLATTTLTLPDDTTTQFPIDSFSKHCLLNGIDQLGYILSFEDQIKAYEGREARR